MIDMIDSLVSSLKRLRPGFRHWYWMCFQADDVTLLLESFQNDPKMQKLLSRAKNISLSSGAFVSMGIASINNSSGNFEFGGKGLTMERLEAFANWVSDQLDEYPVLARMKDTQFVQLTNGVVFDRHIKSSLWSHFPKVMRPGSVEEIDQHLSLLKPGKEYYFWITDKGPSGDPYLMLAPTRKDPNAKKFTSRVGQVKRCISSVEQSLNGVAHMTRTGTLVLTTQGKLRLAQKLIQDLITSHKPLLGRLATAKIAQIKSGAITKTIDVIKQKKKGLDLSTQLKAFRAVSKGKTVAFWFTSSDINGKALLLMDENKNRLKKNVKSVLGKGRTIHGRVSISPKGWFHFQSQQSFPKFILQLASWAERNREEWPALSPLKGSRLTQYDKSGAIIDRQKNDNCWHFWDS